MAWRAATLGLDEHLRPVPPESLHLTLVFLGWRSTDSMAAVEPALGEACAAPARPVLGARRVVALPRRRPRVLALELEDPGGLTEAIHRAVVDRLVAAGLHEREQRPFWPHITLARVRRGGAGAAWVSPYGAPATPAEAVELDRVTLFRSHLDPRGARYEALASRPLACPG